MAEIIKDNPGVIARPPRLYLGALAIGLLVDWAWPVAVIPTAYQFALGGICGATGLTILFQAMRQFQAQGTNVPTNQPATALVTDGAYLYSRNPIYVGLSFLYFGVVLAVDSVWVLGLLVPLLVVMRYGVINREERYLETKFGQPYAEFKRVTPRWF